MLYPLVLDYGDVPWVRDPAVAREAPELAVLSAMAHPTLETAEAAGAALALLPEDLRKLYRDVIWSGLPELVRCILKARMIEGYDENDPTDIVHRFVTLGREEGLRRGREEGLRSAITAIVVARLPALREELETRLRGLREPHLLELLPRLDQARDEESVRALLSEPTNEA